MNGDGEIEEVTKKVERGEGNKGAEKQKCGRESGMGEGGGGGICKRQKYTEAYF